MEKKIKRKLTNLRLAIVEKGEKINLNWPQFLQNFAKLHKFEWNLKIFTNFENLVGFTIYADKINGIYTSAPPQADELRLSEAHRK